MTNNFEFVALIIDQDLSNFFSSSVVVKPAKPCGAARALAGRYTGDWCEQASRAAREGLYWFINKRWVRVMKF